MDTFPLLLTLALVLAVGLALGAVIGALWARSRPQDDVALAALQQRVADHAVVREGLERLQDQLSDLSHDRAAWQAQLPQEVRLRSTGAVPVDLTARISQLETNVDIEASAFDVAIPPGAANVTLEELRESGPLRGQ